MDSVVALIVQLFPARDDSEVANNDVVRMTMLPMTMTMILTKRVAKRRADDDDIIVRSPTGSSKGVGGSEVQQARVPPSGQLTEGQVR